MMTSRYFKPEVEMILRLIGGVVLSSLLVLPIAWGYQQRRQARVWKEIACSYRLAESARRATFLAIEKDTANPCGRLRELGLASELSAVVPVRLASHQALR